MTIKERLLSVARTAGSLREAYKDDKKSPVYCHARAILDGITAILKELG